MRVVSVACSNTEIVAALGRVDLLVGVDDHSDRPAEPLEGLPRVGPDLDIDVERVLDLAPDLVLASDTVPGHERVIAALEGAGLEVRAFAPRSLEDVRADVREIAALLGARDEGRALDARLAAVFRPGPAPSARTGRRPRVLVQWWNRPTIAPGGLSWVADMIERAGGENALGREPVQSRPLEDEEVAALDPDAIVVSWCGVDPRRYRPEVVLRNPAWRDVAAVRAGRVACVPEAWLGRPGPGLERGMEALARVVREAAGAA